MNSSTQTTYSHAIRHWRAQEKHYILKLKYTGTYETSAQINHITRLNIPGDNYVRSHHHESLNLFRGRECKDEWWHRLVFWVAINICKESSVYLYRTVEISCTFNIGHLAASMSNNLTTRRHGIRDGNLCRLGHTVPNVTSRYKLKTGGFGCSYIKKEICKFVSTLVFL